MRNPETIIHDGQEIIFLDYSNLKTLDEVSHMVIEGSKLIRSKPSSSVLSLVNVENMHFNNDIRNVMTENVKGNNNHVKATAVYGLKGLISIMFKSFMAITGRKIKSFDSKESALNYLVNY